LLTQAGVVESHRRAGHDVVAVVAAEREDRAAGLVRLRTARAEDQQRMARERAGRHGAVVRAHLLDEGVFEIFRVESRASVRVSTGC
jgi:hypothetical protein